MRCSPPLRHRQQVTLPDWKTMQRARGVTPPWRRRFKLSIIRVGRGDGAVAGPRVKSRVTWFGTLVVASGVAKQSSAVALYPGLPRLRRSRSGTAEPRRPGLDPGSRLIFLHRHLPDCDPALLSSGERSRRRHFWTHNACPGVVHASGFSRSRGLRRRSAHWTCL